MSHPHSTLCDIIRVVINVRREYQKQHTNISWHVLLHFEKTNGIPRVIALHIQVKQTAAYCSQISLEFRSLDIIFGYNTGVICFSVVANSYTVLMCFPFLTNPTLHSCLFTEINECDSRPCQNGATCKDGLNAYNCYCVDGYNGTNCETGMF